MLAIMATGLVAVSLAGADSPLTETRGTLTEWVQTRQAIARARADWSSDKSALEQNAALLDRELTSVREQWARVETNQAAVVTQRESLRALEALYRDGLEAVRERAAGLEAGLRRLEPLFPPALRAVVQPLLNRLPTDSSVTNVALVPRLLTLITLLNEVDKFNSAISVAEETRRDPEGREVAVDVLYAGLGQAWFVSKTGAFAGVGVPESSGWQWKPRNEVGPMVTQAIRIYRNELPAEFVALPLELR
jgi:hypothetical protein